MDDQKVGMKPPRPRPAKPTEQAIGDLIHGLAELLKPLRGSATVGEILEQLTSAGADAYRERELVRGFLRPYDHGSGE